MLWADWPHGLSVVAVVVVPIHVARIEVHIPRVVRVVRVERTRPIVAVRTSAEQTANVAVTSSRQVFCVSGTILFEAKGMLLQANRPISMLSPYFKQGLTTYEFTLYVVYIYIANSDSCCLTCDRNIIVSNGVRCSIG